jgi:uncharacterized protein
MTPATSRLPGDRFSPIEFPVVLGVALGHFIFRSLNDVLSGNVLGTQGYGDFYSADEIYDLVSYELTLLPFLVAILFFGGWRPRDFRLGLSRRSTAIGVVVFAGLWTLDWFTVWAMKAMFPALHSAIEMWWSYYPDPAPGLGAILLLALVNSVFEEVFVCAYVVKALHRRFGLVAAIWVSTALRASYHLYQGLTAAPLHIAFGLVQGSIYARYGRLWPLILTHALTNFVPDALHSIWGIRL